jgi:hypothetical protein
MLIRKLGIEHRPTPSHSYVTPETCLGIKRSLSLSVANEQEFTK